MHSSELFDENLTGKSGLLDQMISYAGEGILMSPTPSEPYGGWELNISKVFWWIKHFREPRTQQGMTLCKYKNIILIIF